MSRMLVEERTYTTHPGKWREDLARFEAEGLAVQHHILGSRILRCAPSFTPLWQEPGTRPSPQEAATP